MAFLLRSIGIGISIAVLLLMAIPSLRVGNPFANDLVVDRTQPLLSYNYAVRRASPAVVNIYTRRYNYGITAVGDI